MYTYIYGYELEPVLPAAQHSERMPTYADVFRRMPTYADVC